MITTAINDKDHEHCWHTFRGLIHMVIPDGHAVQKCCKCKTTRTVHVDHLHDTERHGRGLRRW